ncbi:DUF2835 domain-containing protein [Marinobacterium arenosum]|uniref:DUF2835 domain-containing protein n=1 Tax=Marinobacterium arenosum TaxID=2862496 RepID=UPI001C97D1F0|nr:DUF2835 domain-containing protein [Marinobacterium arenosum]MBY4677996.1 DUF2835 domain-containing protein [Marinobacterium arenosum]
MQTVIVDIHISSEQYLAHYQGRVTDVVARALDGRRVRFPSNLLQPFLLHDGIRGRFQIEFDRNGKFQGIRRL